MGRLGGPGEEALPCDYFDLICGTSTGGLIVIMLGRLRMSVKDCIKVFKDLGEEVFGLHKFGRGANLLDGHRFPADKLANAIKKTVWAYSEYYSEKTVMKDCRENACKTFVVAIRGCEVDAPNKRFRTYDNPFLSQSADSCAIWEAGRATACAPSYFPEIQIPANNGIIYADGALGYNNPGQQALSEARSLWGDGCDISCLLSIGTGQIPKLMHSPKSIVDLVQILTPIFELATDCERVHLETEQDLRHRGYYHRFNLPLKNDIALHEWKKMEKIGMLAEAYALEMYDSIADCAAKLH